MGRAQIRQALGEGRYRIVRLPDESFVSAEMQRANTAIGEASATRSAIAAQLAAEESSRNEIANAIDELIGTLSSAPEDERAGILDQYQALIRESLKVSGRIADLQWQDVAAIATIGSAQRRLTELARGNPEPEVAWCADYTEQLAVDSEVAVFAINDEEQPGRELIVAPQQSPYRPGGWMPADDGILQPREWMTEGQAFFNAAVLPGVQRYRPRHRVAIIQSIDEENDQCAVTLAPAVSSAQDLPINANPNLGAVPIVYMTCNADAFEVGDRVVVEFINRDWDAPVVVGFESEPRPCLTEGEGGYVMLPVDDNSPSGWEGPTNLSRAHYAGFGYGEGAVFGLRSDTMIESGPHFWRGADGKIVSFNHGGSGRYGFAPRQTALTGHANVYLLGARIDTGEWPAPFNSPRGVMGAGIINDSLFFIAHHPSGEELYLYQMENPWDALEEAFDPHNVNFDPQAAVNALGITAASWNLNVVYDDDGFGLLKRPWIVSPDGTKAAMVASTTGAGTGHDWIYRMSLIGGDMGPRGLNPIAISIERQQLTQTSPNTRLRYDSDIISGTTSNTTNSWNLPDGWAKNIPHVSESELDDGFLHHDWVFGWSKNPEPGMDDCAHSVIDTGATVEPPLTTFGGAYIFWIIDSRVCAYQTEEIGFWMAVNDPEYTIAQRMIQYWSRGIFTSSVRQFVYSGVRHLGVDYDSAGNEMLVKLEPTPRSLATPGKMMTFRKIVTEWLSQVPNVFQGIDGGWLLNWHFGQETGSQNPWIIGPVQSWLPRDVEDESGFAWAGHAELHITVGGVPVKGTRIGISEDDFDTPEWAGELGEGFENCGVMGSSWGYRPTDPKWHRVGIDYPGGETTHDEGEWVYDTSSNSWTFSYAALQDLDAAQGAAVLRRFQSVYEIDDWGTNFDVKISHKKRELAWSGRVRGQSVDLGLDNWSDWVSQSSPYDGSEWISSMDAHLDILRHMHDDTLYINENSIAEAGRGWNDNWGMNSAYVQASLWVRDSQSVLISFAADDRRTIYMEIGGAPYDLETALDVLTKDNLRLIDIGPV